MRPQDVRAVLRLARKQPFFSGAIVLMLALGLGASTAIFSVVHGVLLKPLPFPEADRLLEVWATLPARNIPRTSFTEANFWDMRDWNRAFEELGALHSASFTLTGEGVSPERVAKTILNTIRHEQRDVFITFFDRTFVTASALWPWLMDKLLSRHYQGSR